MVLFKDKHALTCSLLDNAELTIDLNQGYLHQHRITVRANRAYRNCCNYSSGFALSVITNKGENPDELVTVQFILMNVNMVATLGYNYKSESGLLLPII